MLNYSYKYLQYPSSIKELYSDLDIYNITCQVFLLLIILSIKVYKIMSSITFQSLRRRLQIDFCLNNNLRPEDIATI